MPLTATTVMSMPFALIQSNLTPVLAKRDSKEMANRAVVNKSHLALLTE